MFSSILCLLLTFLQFLVSSFWSQLLSVVRLSSPLCTKSLGRQHDQRSGFFSGCTFLPRRTQYLGTRFKVDRTFRIRSDSDWNIWWTIQEDARDSVSYHGHSRLLASVCYVETLRRWQLYLRHDSERIRISWSSLSSSSCLVTVHVPLKSGLEPLKNTLLD